jgi:hypothetical protein
LLFFTVMISLLLILIFVLVPVINAALNLCWISWWMWLLALGFAVVPIFVGEIQKIFMRNYHLTS